MSIFPTVSSRREPGQCYPQTKERTSLHHPVWEKATEFLYHIFNFLQHQRVILPCLGQLRHARRSATRDVWTSSLQSCLSCAIRVHSATVFFVLSLTSSVHHLFSLTFALLPSMHPCKIDMNRFFALIGGGLA